MFKLNKIKSLFNCFLRFNLVFYAISNKEYRKNLKGIFAGEEYNRESIQMHDKRTRITSPDKLEHKRMMIPISIENRERIDDKDSIKCVTS